VVKLCPIDTFRHLCCKMYHLVTMHRMTDGRTDRQTYDANSQSHCVQYDQLRIFKQQNKAKVICKFINVLLMYLSNVRETSVLT